jgi:hypothetical protein
VIVGIFTLIHHQGIICGVAFPPEAGKRSLKKTLDLGFS